MNAPSFKRAGDAYEYTWADEAVAIELDRFQEHRDGLSCELTIYDKSDAELPRLIHSARFNLAASGTRASLVKTLNERNPLPWVEMLETLCFDSRERYREGDPLIDLKDVTPFQSPRWFLKPYIELGGPSMLAGAGESGKSFLALAMAYTVATGIPLLGSPTQGPTPVIYLDWETGPDVHAERLWAITAGANGPGVPSIHYRRMVSSLSEAAATVRRDIDKVNAGLVIVDSLGYAGDGPPEESQTALALFRAIRTFRVPTLTIHHKRKAVAGGSSTDRDNTFGSVYFQNSVRQLWAAEAVQSEEKGTTIVSLANLKSNNQRRSKTHALRLRFDNNDADQLMALVITKAEVADVPELASKLPVREQVLAALRHQPNSTVHEVVDESGLKLDTVKVTLSQLKRDGKIVSLPDHRWGLAAQATES